MADQKKLDRWAEKLLDTGKRNNLISFRDTKSSSSEVVIPDCQTVFSKCSVGHTFEVFDPKIPETALDEEDTNASVSDTALGRSEYIAEYSNRIRGDRLLVYSPVPNPVSTVKNIAKKAEQALDETGINVVYLAFGFVRWNEKENSEVYYKAPLLLVHVTVNKGSILETVKIEVSDDDVIVNPTFDYLLRAEFDLALPEYVDGESLSDYYSKVSTAFRTMGWDIIDECKLGLFSFLKINMYEDLKQNAEKVLANNNVQALLGEPVSEGFGHGESGTETERVTDNPLIDLHTVVDADSSQIEAIEMAKSGRSFVLQGPPGTGKSQTITNIIAECLYDGKTVLFVSEKQAALNVVYDKLKKADLADFCLELHSHKANKRTVIDELNRTLELPKTMVLPMAQEEIRQKEEAQTKLDTYAYVLHKEQPVINKSLYQLYELYSAQRNCPDIQIRIDNIETKGSDYFTEAIKLLEQYVDFVPSIGANYRNNSWYGFKNTSISFEERNQLKEDIAILLHGYNGLLSSTARIKERYETPGLSYADSVWWKSFLSYASESDVITSKLLSRETFENAVPHIKTMAEESKKIISIRNELEDYDISVFSEIDGSDLNVRLNGEFSSFISRLFSKDYKNLIARILQYSKTGKKLTYKQALRFSEYLLEYQRASVSFNDNESSVSGCIGSCYTGVETPWDHVLADLDVCGGFINNENEPLLYLSELKSEDFAGLRDAFKADADDLNEKLTSVEEAKSHIEQHFSSDIFNLEKNEYEYCINKLNKCLTDYDKLSNWISFKNLLDQLEDLELTQFVDEIIRKQIDPSMITGVYRKIFYMQWIEYIIFTEPTIAAFSRIIQDQAVRDFNEKDKLQYGISKRQIKSELSKKRPSLDLVAGGSSVATLRREGQKKRKQMPIRKLIGEIGPLVQLLKPCFLMSPLSVSTYLDPEKISFDTVIFDEASQIFPQDAIGAIYRGQQIIVVGDSRQMPPSNFFNSSMEIEDEDEEVGDVTDFESILDLCSAVFDTERLAWHYRSHYEQLIAFSNLNFYNNRLVTFPSSSTDHRGIGVDYYYAGGTFDRKSKTNRVEAEYIVDLIYQNINDYPERSLGVVAFSVAQQDLIDKLLLKKRETDPSYEWFFKSDIAEPFFIKNLETVQGDERDTIIFSVAYAKDSQGRFINNFGPLNREGGERRLNVAVTRAKDNVQLVASIHYTDISLTGSEGVRLLRSYLDYAENGEQALERSITVPEEDVFDSEFEQEVCDYLRDNGFTVDTQVGCSGYRIDLALRKPDSSNYLLAIECDGATYHRSKNARDRDSLRQRVLENMGWQFYRIWSTDWYRNKSVEKERLISVAKEAIENADNNQTSITKIRNQDVDDSSSQYETEINEPDVQFDTYIECDAERIIMRNENILSKGVHEILKLEEVPLSEEYLLRRIVSLFGREKVTNVVIDAYNYHMRGCEKDHIIRKDGFLYLDDMTDIKLHVPGDRRDVRYISIEELADGMYTVIKHSIEITEEGLFRTMTVLLSFSRTGEAMENRFREALDYLKKHLKVKEDNGLLSVTIA